MCDTACRYYQMATVGDVAQDRVLSQQMMLSRGMAKAADARQRDANFMGGVSLNARSSRSYGGMTGTAASRPGQTQGSPGTGRSIEDTRQGIY